MTIQACKVYVIQLFACGAIFSQMHITDAGSVAWYEPPPVETTSDANIELTADSRQLLKGSTHVQLSWRFSVASNLNLIAVILALNSVDVATVVPSTGNAGPASGFEGRFNVTGTSQRATLIIFNVTEDDDGEFGCELNTFEGAQNKIFKRKMKVEVVVEASFISSPSGNQTISEGSNLTLFCDATGKPTPNVTWTRVLKNGTDGDLVFFGNPWVIVNISRTATGTYRCTAYNGIGNPVSHSLYIDVTYQPENVRLTTNTSRKVCTGDVTNFTCTAEANPAVHTYLLLENDTVIKKMGTSGTWIKSLENAGMFVFRCEANNSVQGVGKSGDTILTVDVSASVEQDENKVVKEGDNVEVYCNVTAGIPVPTVMWIKVTTGEHIKGNPLNITNISRAQAGEYKCTAKNICGVVSAVEIDVQYSPTITSEGHTIDVSEGSPASVSCPVVGNPHPTITWYKESGTSPSTMINANNILWFPETVFCDSGLYTCFAKNFLGNVTVTFHLRVEKSEQTTEPTLSKPTTKVVESIMLAQATIDKSCNDRLDVEKRFPSLACERVRHLGCLSAQAVDSRCGSVIVDFEMKFNQSAVVSEVLNTLKAAAKKDNFDEFKVDPNSIEQISPPPTDTSGTKAAEECKCSCNDVILAAVVGVLVFIIIALILYIVWLHKKGTAGKQRRYTEEERGVYNNEMALDELQPNSHIPSRSTQLRSEYMNLTGTTTVNDEAQRVAQSADYAPLHPLTRSWEIEKQHVTIEKIIGKGAFGQVAKGTATELRGRPGKTTVAVKMLKCKYFFLLRLLGIINLFCSRIVLLSNSFNLHRSRFVNCCSGRSILIHHFS